MIKLSKKMMIAVGAVVLLAIGIAVVINIDTTQQSEEMAQNENVYTIFSEGTEDIAEVQVNNGGEVIRAVNNGDWTINDWTTDDVDTNKAYGLAGTVSMLTSKNKIEENPQDLSKYGLENPAITVVVKLKNGNENKLYIGDKSPTLGEYFIMKDGDSSVYTMYEFKVDTLMQPLSYYKDFNRFNINIDDITNIKIERSDETIEIKLIDDIDENTNNVWEMVSPYESGANDDYIDNKILAPLSELSMNVPVDSSIGDINESDEMTVSLTIRPYDNNTGKYSDEYIETFKVLKIDGDKGYVQYKNNIFEVPAEKINFSKDSSFNIVSKLQALVDISKVSSVTVDYDNKSYKMGIEHKDNGETIFTLDDKETNNQLSQQMYKCIAELAADSIYEGETTGETIMKLTYEGLSESDDTVIEFKSVDNLNCAVFRNGKAEFKMKTSKLDEFKEVFDEYVKNPMAEEE